MCKAVLKFFMQNVSTKQEYTINVTWDDNAIVNNIEGPSTQSFTVEKGDNFSIPVSFKTGYQKASITGAEIVNDNIVINNVSANADITITSEAIPRTITYNLTNASKPSDAPTIVRNGESFSVVISANDNYNINPESISVTGCTSYRHEDYVVGETAGNIITQTTLYVEGVNNDVTINVSAIAVDDSYNVNIVTSPLGLDILTATTEDTDLTSTTLFTGSIYDEKEIYIYLPWKYNWLGASVTEIDNVAITDPSEVTINGEKYTKAKLTITAVEGYQTPDVEVIISAAEKPTYTIQFVDTEDVVTWDNSVTSAYEGQSLMIKPIVLEGYTLSQITVVNVETSESTTWTSEEDINAAINGEKYIVVTGQTTITASYNITFSWSNLENYILGDELSNMTSSGSVTGNYEVSKAGWHFYAQINDGYEFLTSASVITSNPDAEITGFTNDGTNIEFNIVSYKNTTIAIDGVSEVIQVSYAPLNIEVTNTLSRPDNVSGDATFNVASTMQLESYAILRFNNSSTSQRARYVIAGFGDDTNNSSVLNIGYKGGSYNPVTSALWCPSKETLGQFDSIDVTMYGDVQDINLSTISKTQNIYATSHDSNGNEVLRSNTITINGNDTHSSENLYTLTFSELISFDAQNPLVLHYEIV